MVHLQSNHSTLTNLFSCWLWSWVNLSLVAQLILVSGPLGVGSLEEMEVQKEVTRNEWSGPCLVRRTKWNWNQCEKFHWVPLTKSWEVKNLMIVRKPFRFLKSYLGKSQQNSKWYLFGKYDFVNNWCKGLLNVTIFLFLPIARAKYFCYIWTPWWNLAYVDAYAEIWLMLRGKYCSMAEK